MSAVGSYFCKCYITPDVTIFNNSSSAERDFMSVRSYCAEYHFLSDTETTQFLK